jgi:hypothetical protein
MTLLEFKPCEDPRALRVILDLSGEFDHQCEILLILRIRADGGSLKEAHKSVVVTAPFIVMLRDLGGVREGYA